MSFGGGKSKPPSYKAPFTYLGKTAQTGTSSPFADTYSTFRNRVNPLTGLADTGKGAQLELYSKATPTAFMQQGIDQAGGLMNSNLEYLNQTPDQRYAAINSGNDVYYNALRGQMDLQNQQALGRAQIAGAGRGLTNSTAQGGLMAGIQNDQLRREREAQLASFNLGQTTATGNVGTGLGTLSGINNIISPQQQMNQQQLQTLRQAGESINTQNAERQYASDNAQFQHQQAQQAAWGKSIGMLSPAGGWIHSGVTGNPAGATAGSQSFNNMLGAIMPMMGGGGGSMASLGSMSGGGGMNNLNTPTPQFSGFNSSFY